MQGFRPPLAGHLQELLAILWMADTLSKPHAFARVTFTLVIELLQMAREWRAESLHEGQVTQPKSPLAG
jgi:hypothetical protein